jgi:N-acetylmuramoyl-L-alanine amidase
MVEKNITLKLAKLVQAWLRKYRPDCQVLLTRSKDVFIPLEERTAFANTKAADLFVSIHVNAAPSDKLNGIETYFLNLATDEASMRVAARENATSQRSINDLQAILNDLMLNSKINESNRLARMVQRELLGSIRSKYKVTDLKVKQAPCYVLLGAQMPAVLCEVGFVTNPNERSRLGSEAYLNLVAEGIAKGIVKYNDELKQAARR